MLTVPLYFTLFLLLFFLLAWTVLMIINLNHLLRTGTFNFTSFLITVILIIFSAAVLLSTFLLLKDTNWQEPITLWNSAWMVAAFNP